MESLFQKPKFAKDFDLCFDSKIDSAEADIPAHRPYRVINNKDKSEVVLQGKELLAHIKKVCGTLNVCSVLARMSFFPVECAS